MPYALGRKPHDQRRLNNLPHHYAAVQPPPKLLRTHIPFQPGLYHNDDLPVCVAAGLFNAARATAWIKTGADLVTTPEKCLAFYSNVAGIPDTMEAISESDGTELLTALEYTDAHGADLGQQTTYSPLYKVVDTSDRNALASSMLHGMGYLGVTLLECDEQMIGKGTLDLSDGQSRAVVWGGHCLDSWSYTGLGDEDVVMLATWGMLQPATWRWVQARLDEAFALEWPQITRA